MKLKWNFFCFVFSLQMSILGRLVDINKCSEYEEQYHIYFDLLSHWIKVKSLFKIKLIFHQPYLKKSLLVLHTNLSSTHKREVTPKSILQSFIKTQEINVNCVSKSLII